MNLQKYETIPMDMTFSKLAHAIAASKQFQGAYSPEIVISKMLAAQALDIPIFTALQNIDYIDGKSEINGALIAALIDRDPSYDYQILHSDNQYCQIEFFKNGKTRGVAQFSMQEAQQAGLAQKKNWKTYPEDMLFWRAMSRGGKRYCGGLFLGSFYSEGEISQKEEKPTEKPENTEMINQFQAYNEKAKELNDRAAASGINIKTDLNGYGAQFKDELRKAKLSRDFGQVEDLFRILEDKVDELIEKKTTITADIKEADLDTCVRMMNDLADDLEGKGINIEDKYKDQYGQYIISVENADASTAFTLINYIAKEEGL
jgi:hypothetical protein